MSTVTIEDYNYYMEINSTMNSGFLLKEDFVIPKGTRFDLMKSNVFFIEGKNFEASISVNKDNCGRFIIGTDVDDEKFMPIPEAPYDAYFSYAEYKYMWKALLKKADKSLKSLMKKTEKEVLNKLEK